jgi:holdfast attachment protein HfaA
MSTNALCVTLFAALGLASLGFAQLAQAQSASSGLSVYRNGYNGSGLSGQESPVNVSLRDANGNLVITNGVIQTASGSSLFSQQSGGVANSATGVGSTGGATAIGNNLTVSVSGDNNTVIVKATQTNTGAISATDTVLNGKVNLNAGP